MRSILTTLFRATLFLIVSFGTLSGLSAQEKPGEFRELPVRNQINRQYQLAPNTTVQISLIAGPVEIETISGQSAEVNISNSAETQADLNCSDTPIEQTPKNLVIRSKPLCNIVRVNQRVMLRLPRNVNLDLENIAGHVRIGPTEGIVRLNSIAGHVSTGSLEAAEMSSLASGLSMEIDQIREHGVRLSSITGGIELGLGDNLNAQFVAASVIGNVVSDIPSIKISTDGRSDFEAQIGSGGPRITISSVRGGIRLRKTLRLRASLLGLPGSARGTKRLTDFAPGADASICRHATSHGPEGPRGISNIFSLTEESILISLNLRTTVS